MINNIRDDINYKKLVSTQIKETMQFLLDKGQEFAITANINAIEFNPQLPIVIKKRLPKFPLFVLSNYTYSTIQLVHENLSFEAGFGSENFGSIVNIPYHAVFQIAIDESILFVNLVATIDKPNENLQEKSRNVFKNNPNNKGLIK